MKVEVDEEVEGVFVVSFQHKGEKFTHGVHGFDWIDPSLLVKINEVISDTETQFYALDTGDQSAFIVALNGEEREEIEAVRG